MDRPTFPLNVHDDERGVLRTALRSFRDDLGHKEHRVAEVLDDLLGRVPETEAQPLVLDAAAMKVTWSALHALLDGTDRSQEEERGHLRDLLDRLPGEHDIRAIDLDAELDGRRAAG
jgi:hypothetical protein